MSKTTKTLCVSSTIEQPQDGEQHLPQLARFVGFGPSSPGIAKAICDQISGLGILATCSQNVTFWDAF
jgi:hypothetical protein